MFGVASDSFQPPARFLTQDGGRNRRTKEYSASARAPQVHLHCRRTGMPYYGYVFFDSVTINQHQSRDVAILGNASVFREKPPKCYSSNRKN